jgi:hypothetical protein
MRLVSRDLWLGGSPPPLPPSPPGFRAARWRMGGGEYPLAWFSTYITIYAYRRGEGTGGRVKSSVVRFGNQTLPVNGGGEWEWEWVPLYIQAWAPSLWRRIRYKGPLPAYIHNSVPYTTAAVKDCPLQSFFARTIVTCRCGMGYKIPPWGKGLIIIVHFFSILPSDLE